MGEALERTVEAGQALFAGRQELIVAEARMFVREVGIFLVSSAVAVVGWVHLMRGVSDGLSDLYPRFVVEIAIGLLHLTIAILVWLRMRAR